MGKMLAHVTAPPLSATRETMLDQHRGLPTGSQRKIHAEPSGGNRITAKKL